MEKNDLFWDVLLDFIAEGHVVPVVGRDLLKVRYQDRDVLLYPLLAQKLARKLGLEISQNDVPKGDEITAVVGEYVKQNPAHLDDVYTILKLAMPGDAELSVPQSLSKLAAIDGFKLFVTTTFDSLLERAIKEVRNEQPTVISYSPQADLDRADLPRSLEHLPGSVLFHIFGKISASSYYAVTEEDTLEFLHALQSESRLPRNLFDELSKKKLLLLGCSFGDWLVRFFLRTTKDKRLLRSGTNYLADERVMGDKNLVLFLSQFSPGTKVCAWDVHAFIDELHRRWIENYGARERTVVTTPTAAATYEEPAAVFLSYASEDRATAVKINEALRAEGIEVFFDKEDLESGDDWETTITSTIRKCWLFVPLISRHTLTAGRRFFRIEWRVAEREALMASPTQSFIVPVVIDDTPPTVEAVPEKFRKLHWRELREGDAIDQFAQWIKQRYREYQKQKAVAA